VPRSKRPTNRTKKPMMPCSNLRTKRTGRVDR
jgi:hypothetical protein